MLIESRLQLGRQVAHMLAKPASSSQRPFSATATANRQAGRLRLSAAASYHGKPGSPAYVPPIQTSQQSDPSELDSGDNNLGSRPDWRSAPDRHGNSTSTSYRRLKQGLPADHPLSIWRDAQLAKEPWGAGHDWFFVQPGRNNAAASEEEGADSIWAGVADGVGGWEDSGVDPSHFSQALMYHAWEAVKGLPEQSPKTVLSQAYDGVQSEKGVIAGSSTATLVHARSHDGRLTAANLGDSTFFILRPTPGNRNSSLGYKVIHAQPSQTHFFNAPRQLAKFPRGASKKGALIDMPKDADEFEATLSPGDIVVLATDGFSDNVFPVELEELVALVKERHTKSQESPESANASARATDPAPVDSRSLAKTLADVCVNYARICSFKPNKQSPFEIEARRYGHHDLKGGKVDDVCVVVIVAEAAVAESTESGTGTSGTDPVKAKL